MESNFDGDHRERWRDGAFDHSGQASAIALRTVCAGCGSHLLQLQSCVVIGEAEWLSTSWCPECGALVEEVLSGRQASAVIAAAEVATRRLRRTLRRLERTHMDEAARRFTRALRADQLRPEDF